VAGRQRSCRGFYTFLFHVAGRQRSCRDLYMFIPRELSTHYLQAGQPSGRSSSSDRGKIFLLFMSSRPVLGPAFPMGIEGNLQNGKAHGPLNWPFTYN
jgi:hypothetical protein